MFGGKQLILTSITLLQLKKNNKKVKFFKNPMDSRDKAADAVYRLQRAITSNAEYVYIKIEKS